MSYLRQLLMLGLCLCEHVTFIVHKLLFLSDRFTTNIRCILHLIWNGNIQGLTVTLLGFTFEPEDRKPTRQYPQTFKSKSNTARKSVEQQNYNNLLDEDAPCSFLVEGVLLVLFFLGLLKFNELPYHMKTNSCG